MSTSTHNNGLWLANRSIASAGDAWPANSLNVFRRRGLLLETCLRQLVIAPGCWPGLDGTADEARAGRAAYRYALEVATGLRSAVPGETNILGQFRAAVESFRREADASVVAALMPTLHRLLNDGRAIRRSHLQGIGGSSYGSLVRGLITPGRNERVLFIGGGEFARSMLPYFTQFPTGVWNRHALEPADWNRARLFAPGDGISAARWADHAILTTPADADNDRKWRRWLAGAGVRHIVHLGHRGGGLVGWKSAEAVYDLDDVFTRRRNQAALRTRQLQRAERACRDAAAAPDMPAVAVAPLGLAHA